MGESLFDESWKLKRERVWVLVVDDDREFALACIGGLEDALKTMEPACAPFKFEIIVDRKGFEEAFDRLKSQGILANIVYALVDLKLPSEWNSDESSDKQTENGNRVIERLRDESEIPIYLISTASQEYVEKSVLRHRRVNFVQKIDFDVQVERIARQILVARDRPWPPPREEVPRVLAVQCPVKVRGHEWELPLAHKSARMSELLSSIDLGIYQEAAAVLLLGGVGVEFEQISWHLYHSICGKSSPPYRFRVVNCSADADLGKLKKAISEEGGRDESEGVGSVGQLTYWFVKNLQDLDEEGALTLVGLLDEANHLGPGGNRVTLAGVKNKVDSRILDRFSLAGYPDFYIIDIPALTERKPDIPAYLQYFADRRNQDSRHRYLHFDRRALEVIENAVYPRNFKDLANGLDELFRRCQDNVVTVWEVQRILKPEQYFLAVWRAVIEEILVSERPDSPDPGTVAPWDYDETHLLELCTALLLAREEAEQNRYGDEWLYDDLQLMKYTIEHCMRKRDDSSFIEDLMKEESFWPLTRFPVSAGVVKALERHGFTIGLVRKSK